VHQSSPSSRIRAAKQSLLEALRLYPAAQIFILPELESRSSSLILASQKLELTTIKPE
jgi:hypothetical protein